MPIVSLSSLEESCVGRSDVDRADEDSVLGSDNDACHGDIADHHGGCAIGIHVGGAVG